MNKTRRSKNVLPKGWDERKVRKVLTHYEKQAPEQAVAEDEAAFGRASRTVMKVPSRLVPAIRKLIATRGR